MILPTSFDGLSRFFVQDLGQIDKFPIEANMGLFAINLVGLPWPSVCGWLGQRELIYCSVEKSQTSVISDQCDYIHQCDYIYQCDQCDYVDQLLV